MPGDATFAPKYLALVIGTVLLGWASRRFRSNLAWFIGEYAGDTLWAAMVYLMAAMIWRNAGAARLAAGAFGFSMAVEVSQLCQAEWINTWRSKPLGGLVLGFGFLWSDLVCYGAGLAWAAGVDWLAQRKLSRG